MKKILLIGMVLLLVVGMSVFAGGKKEEQAHPNIRMATGGTAGTYYAYGTALAQILNEKTKVPITVQSSGASKVNIQLMDAGDIELAMVQNDVMDYAWKGVDLFTGEQTQKFNAMAALYAEVIQVVANPASGIRSIADLRGKNVSVGDAGSGTEFNARHILEAYGITFNDINKQNLGFGPSADAIKDNKLDAAFVVAGAPTPAIVDLAMNKDVIVLNVDDAQAAELSRKYPFYTQFPIPAGSYRGQSSPVKTVAVKATFIVSPKIPENTVYELTKALFSNIPQIIQAHAKGKELSTAYAVDGISVPFHPGAVKYFKEVGAMR